MFHRVRVQYDRKGMDNEWLVVSNVDNLGDECVPCGSTTNAERSQMKVKRWIRPAAAATENEVNISTCPRGIVIETYIGHCWQLVEVVQNARIRFQTNGSAHSVVSSECEFRKVRKWKGSNVEKADDGWEIIEDLKNISLPAQQLEEEGKEEDKEKGKDDQDAKSHQKEKERDGVAVAAAAPALAKKKPEAKKAPPRKAEKKTPATKKRKAAGGKVKSAKDDSDFEEIDEDDDDDFDVKKEKKKHAKKPRKAGAAVQKRVAKKAKKSDEEAHDCSTITDTHPNGLPNATKVSLHRARGLRRSKTER